MVRRYTHNCFTKKVADGGWDPKVRDQIDVQRCTAVLLHHGWLIAALGVIAAVLTYLLGFIMPTTYAASALVGIIDRSNVVAFDPRFLPIERDLPTFEPYTALASSDAVLSGLLHRLGDRAPGDGSTESLRERLTAALAADKVLLQLTASADTPDEAAMLANAWADVVFEHASALYEAMDVALLTRYEERLDEARDDLVASRDALVRHDVAVQEQAADDALAWAEAEMEALQAELLALQAAERDLQAIQAALDSAQDADAVLSGSPDAFLAKVLWPLGEEPPSFDLVGDDDPASLVRLTEQVLSQRMDATGEAFEAAREGVIALREAKVKEAAEREALALAVREAEDRVLLLSTEAERVRLAADDSRIQVALTSPAGTPTKPSSGGPSMLAAGVAGLLGLVLGSVLALCSASRRQRFGDSASAGV